MLEQHAQDVDLELTALADEVQRCEEALGVVVVAIDAEVRVSASLQQHADDGGVSGVAGQQQGRLKHSTGAGQQHPRDLGGGWPHRNF